ncbi:MAG: aryl-sulfate sulfotransferase [Mediterranea sp.]|jgi:arylsulfate sulfotransferase|nr:aryl-sulfate sulfotransferase [Mediterranea sp.]
MNRFILKQYLRGGLALTIGLAIAACGDDNLAEKLPDNPPVEQPDDPQPQAPSFTATVAAVTVDPTGFCPLAARIRVNTSGGMAIQASVRPKPDAVTPAQEHLFPYSEGAAQFIDVLGLYPDYTNEVELTFLDQQGAQKADTLIKIPVGPLTMPNVPPIRRVLTANISRMEPGMNLALFTPSGENDTSMPYMVDADGEIRYILNWRESEKMAHTIFHATFARMKDGNWLTADNNTGRVHIVNPLGEWIRTYDFMPDGYRFHHEAREMANGNLISNMTQQNALRADGVTKRIRDQIVEWDPQTGTIVHEWDLANMIDSMRFGENVLGVVPQMHSLSNWVHNNAIVDWGDNYIASSRYQGVFKFKPSGELMWILAPHRGWREQFRPYLLTPLDVSGNVIADPTVADGATHTDDFDWVWGAHAPEVLPDDNPDDHLQRIIVYDNGLARNFVYNYNQTPYSRAVIYEIDEERMTIRQVWNFGKDMPQYYTSERSNAAYLPQTGNVLFCPSGGTTMSNGNKGACVIEIDPDTDEVVYHLELERSGGFHRVYRLPLYPD